MRAGVLCSTLCITWYPAICLPCDSWSLRTLAVVTYAQLRMAILPFQLQGQSAMVLAASLSQDRLQSTRNSLPIPLCSCHLPSFRRELKRNCSPERIISKLVTVYNCKSRRTANIIIVIANTKAAVSVYSLYSSTDTER